MSNPTSEETTTTDQPTTERVATGRALHFEHDTGRALVEPHPDGPKELVTESALQLEITTDQPVHTLVDERMAHVETLSDAPLTIALAEKDGVETVRVMDAET